MSGALTRAADSLCRDRALFSDTLDAIKFVCKDIWAACWDKQVDNLRTNHRGVYVLQDNAFKPVFRLSSWEGRADAVRRARLVRRWLGVAVMGCDADGVEYSMLRCQRGSSRVHWRG